jgi:3-hydroxyisobutyrate dehydrogenase-like beta-hydroxyacid dehydrogenase
MKVCVFGLGEAGSLIAADLAAAPVEVHGYDPAPVATPPGVHRHEDPRGAAGGAGLVLAITGAADAPVALAQALDTIPAGSVYADLATASAGLKRDLAAQATAAGLGFADVALMAPVAGLGLRTPALVSGPAAGKLVSLLGPFGMPIEHAGEVAGAAATRKLLRSIVVKGLTAVIMESMRAAEAAGLADETWDNIVASLTAADEAFVRRLVEGTPRHAARRVHEMEAATALLEELGVAPTMTTATAQHLRDVAASGPGVEGLPVA